MAKVAKAEKVTKAVAETVVVKLDAGKEYTGSVRYATADPKAPVLSIYVMRSFAKKMPASITVTIAAG